MFRSQHHISHPVYGIHTGCVDFNSVFHSFYCKAELCTGGTANPVLLHGLNAFRPAFQLIQILEQSVCISSNLKEPLREVLFHYRILTAPASAFFYLFIGKNGVTGVAPVNLCFLLISQSAFIENFKQLLGMLIVIFATGQYFSVPVIGQSQFSLLTSHVFNIGICPFCRSNTMLNGSIFSRHTKGIISHRMDDVESLHLLESGNHIANRIVSYMPHVKIPGWIWEHFQDIIFLLVRILFCGKGLIFQPLLLPLFFNFLRYVFVYHVHHLP